MDQLSFKIENFEGPLDLLLHLVSRHKMTLTDVRINLLIDQYLELVGGRPEELEPASEFIEMAARLVYMKSAALLPRQEEAEELQRELVGQLVEYQLCKIAAEKLRYMQEGIFFSVRRPAEMELPAEYERMHDKLELQAAFMGLAGKAVRNRVVSMEKFEEIVTAPVVSVTARVMYILRSLRRGTVKSVRELFGNSRGRSESVATFLGLLELIKAKRITVAADGGIAPGIRGMTPGREPETVR